MIFDMFLDRDLKQNQDSRSETSNLFKEDKRAPAKCVNLKTTKKKQAKFEQDQELIEHKEVQEPINEPKKKAKKRQQQDKN